MNFLPQIAQIEKIFYLPDLTIRSLAAQKLLPSVVIIALFGIVQASLTLPSLIARSRSTDDTDFTPSELLFHTELFFISHGMHGMHGNADASPAKILFLMFCFSQIIFFSRMIFFLSRNARNFFAKGSKTVGSRNLRFACHPDLNFLPQIF